jgi:hypothetical protein
MPSGGAWLGKQWGNGNCQRPEVNFFVLSLYVVIAPYDVITCPIRSTVLVGCDAPYVMKGQTRSAAGTVSCPEDDVRVSGHDGLLARDDWLSLG